MEPHIHHLQHCDRDFRVNFHGLEDFGKIVFKQLQYNTFFKDLTSYFFYKQKINKLK